MIEQLTDISSFDWKKVGKTRDDGGNLPANENPSVSLDKFSSDSEQSIPYEVSPLIFEISNFKPFFGIVEPGGA